MKKQEVSKKQKRRKRLVLIVLGLAVLGAITVAAYVGLVAYGVRLDKKKLTIAHADVRIEDINGNSIDNAGRYVPIEQIPADLVNAFVAVEDKRFYSHNGIDIRRIGGALIQNLRKRDTVQGASTISCQLIKNTHLNNEKTIERKIKEAKLAIQLEKQYSKEEIMEMYLNVIYFGSGVYGVGSAAHNFFGKDPKQLTTAECAAIAATTVNPSLYSPRLNYENNNTRKNLVLRLMHNQGYIDDDTYENACDTHIALVHNDTRLYNAYCINCIDEAERLTGLSHTQLANGYTIRTYCDPELQLTAQSVLPDDADGIAALCTNEGHIVAFASTYAMRQSGVRRQMGSTIKPFVYACAIEQGNLLPDTPLDDSPTSFGDYHPANYHDKYYGIIAARDALAKSSNIAACKVLNYCGIDLTYRFLLQCGLPLSPQDKHTGLALGGLTYGVTADEVLTAYTALCDNGVRHSAAMVAAIVDDKGNTMYRHDDRGTRVMQSSSAYLTSKMMVECTKTGTALRLGDIRGEVAAKTGTVAGKTQNSDAWCVAYTGPYIALCWQGNLSMQANSDIATTGGGAPCVAVRRLLQNYGGYVFERPADVMMCEIDTYTLQTKNVLNKASSNTPLRYRKWIECTIAPPMSTVFEQAPRVKAALTVEDNDVQLQLDANPLCTYLVLVDNGMDATIIDRIDADGPLTRTYGYNRGVWRIVAVLHGNNDLISEPYTALLI